MKHLFWIKEGLLGTVGCFAAAAMYTFLMGTMPHSGDSMSLLEDGCIYLVVIGVLMALIFSLSLQQLLIPLTISFGADRRGVIAGIQLYRLSLMLPVVLASGIMAAVSFEDPRSLWGCLVLVVSAFLFFNALGGLMGTLIGKLSSRLLTGISIALVFIGCILIVVLVVLGAVFLELTKWILWIIFGISALTYAVCTFFETRTVRNFCVR